MMYNEFARMDRRWIVSEHSSVVLLEIVEDFLYAVAISPNGSLIFPAEGAGNGTTSDG